MRLQTIEDFKGREGQTIYAKPTGNNARYHEAGTIVEFTVVKVKRKYITLSQGREDDYCPSNGATASEIKSGYGSNAGYSFYSDKESIQKEAEVASKLKDIRGVFGHYGKVRLTDDQIERMWDIIKEGGQY